MTCQKWIRISLICTILVCPAILIAQVNTNVSIKNTALASNKNYLPLWFHSNQNGKVELNNQFLNLTEFNIIQDSQIKDESLLDWEWGANLVVGFGSTNYNQINQLFSGISSHGWQIKLGLFHDPINYAGLSSSNGNLLRSGNARPYPSLRFFNPEFKPVPFTKEWLSFKFEFEEGILNDNRFVSNAHMHHKSLYFLIKSYEKWDFTFGLEHYVMWGGVSKDKDKGQLPNGFKDYLRYLVSAPGGGNSPEHERLNAAGNHLGTYQLAFSVQFSNFKSIIYLSHPFENNSGMELENWTDNLLGLHFDLNKKTKLINDIVYEIINTRHQNIDNSLVSQNGVQEWKSELYEDYFRNLLYRSGFTYHQRVIGSPLFFPIELETDELDNNWYAIRSNRFFSHHLGITGNISKSINWKGLLTYVQHLGTFPRSYDSAQKQLSGFIEIWYSNSNFPFEPAISLAADIGDNISNNFGIQMSISKDW